MDNILKGKGLKRKGRFSLERSRKTDLDPPRVIGYTDDIRLAKAYQKRAAMRHIALDIFDTTSP